ncbi:MAG: polysaccharide biosynthesis/export family protein [Bacteroidetes bacterium]|nr:polysaccharide biosynthesis/export family protein [Bacteroidota bacterium]
MKYILKPYFLFIIATVALSSCVTLNPSRMLKIPADYPYAKFPDSVKIEPYKIAINDVISFSLYTNDGFKMASISGYSIADASTGSSGGITTFKVRSNGKIKMPILGELEIVGLTVKQAEELLEEKFKQYFVNPFVILEITNKRIYFFRGGTSASIVSLENENTTLFEVLAKAGGVAGGNTNGTVGASGGSNNLTNGMNYASKVKIIRGDLKKPEIYLVDLSKIEGLKDADIIMQANDIVYIEPVINYAYNITSDISSFTGLITSVLSVVLLYTLITKK